MRLGVSYGDRVWPEVASSIIGLVPPIVGHGGRGDRRWCGAIRGMTKCGGNSILAQGAMEIPIQDPYGDKGPEPCNGNLPYL